VNTGTDLADVDAVGKDFQEGKLFKKINTPKRNASVVNAYMAHCGMFQAPHEICQHIRSGSLIRARFHVYPLSITKILAARPRLCLPLMLSTQ
jgi:hypothetical protein